MSAITTSQQWTLHSSRSVESQIISDAAKNKQWLAFTDTKIQVFSL